LNSRNSRGTGRSCARARERTFCGIILTRRACAPRGLWVALGLHRAAAAHGLSCARVSTSGASAAGRGAAMTPRRARPRARSRGGEMRARARTREAPRAWAPAKRRARPTPRESSQLEQPTRLQGVTWPEASHRRSRRARPRRPPRLGRARRMRRDASPSAPLRPPKPQRLAAPTDWSTTTWTRCRSA
jgi:hypothetical protein